MSTSVDFGRRVLAVRWWNVAIRADWRTVIVCVVLAVLIAGLVVLSLTTDLVSAAVLQWRMPRVGAAVVFGAALGVSGAIFQSLLRNPLADPSVIGFTQGSYTGALIVILAINGSYLQLASGALIGGLVTALGVYVLAYRQGVQGFRLIIVGIGVTAMLASLNTWLILKADLEQAISAATWGAGSLLGVSWGQVTVGAACIAALLLMAGLLSRGMRQMELGDDAAAAQGVRVGPLRLGLVVVGVGLTAAVTAASGPIAFISLVAPQVARRVTRSAGISLLPSAIVGALLCLGSDYIAQHVVPTPLPVGIITVMLGGSYLGWLLFTEARRRL